MKTRISLKNFVNDCSSPDNLYHIKAMQNDIELAKGKSNKLEDIFDAMGT